MQLGTVIKRIFSNIIDILLFFSVYILLNYFTQIGSNLDTSSYLFFSTFTLCFAVPLISLGNTFGKLFLNLKWRNINNKSMIFAKYFIYFLAFFPGFSIISLVTEFPFFRIENYSFALSIQFMITIIIVDILIFILSLGKFHLLDYMLNIQLEGLTYRKKELVSLSIFLSFWSIFIFTNLTFIKLDLSVKRLNDSFSKDIYFENFPDDLFYGNKPFVIKVKSDIVFIPSDMHSFLFKKYYDQKIIYLYLPYEIFNSKDDRYKVCTDLILQSTTNDIFSDFEPKQTKLVLRTLKEGKFLEYYNYSYTYYFNNQHSSWGIYGGIKNDSLTLNKYISFVEKVQKDNKINNGKIILNSYLYRNSLIIKINDAKIQFNKVKFDETKMQGRMQSNFPFQSLNFRTNYWNIMDGKVSDMDEELIYLKLARDEVTSKFL